MELWVQFGIALGLGLLVGLQRERADSGPGIRTFPLITLFGAVCGLLSTAHGPWVLASGIVVLGALMVLNNLHRKNAGDPSPGPTTEIAALVMFGVGAILILGHTELALGAGGVVVLLLQWKKPLHRFVQHIGEDDLRAVFRLVLIALVVLPALPDRAFGPYAVINPFRIWLIVVLIVGVSLGGYLLSRMLRGRAGSVLAGVLGGVISSTATTVSYARRTREVHDATGMAALVIAVASTIVFLRATVEVALVAPGVLRSVLPQFAAMTGILLAVSAVAYATSRGPQGTIETAKAPSDLGAAVFFGILYAVVLLGVAVTREHFGDRGLYVVAALSGLTDMDAITLSTAHMMEADQVAIDTGWRMMLVGAMSNIVFKTGVVAVLGSRGLLLRVGLLFGAALLGGAGLLWAWPHIG